MLSPWRLSAIVILGFFYSLCVGCLRSGDTTQLKASELTRASDPRCNPLSSGHCVLPWPSDHFTTPDRAQVTGRSVVFDNRLISPDTLAQLPEGARPEDIFRDSDGFSAAGSILFEFLDKIDESKFEQQKDAYIHVYDMTIGRKVENLSISINKLAASDRKTYVEIYPQVRWEYGHKYVAIVQFAFLTREGNGFYRAPGVESLFAGRTPIAEAYRDVLEFLARQGIDFDSIQNLTAFTVRSQTNVTKPLITAKNLIAAESHPIRNIRVLHYPHASLSAIVYGEFLATDFTNANRGIYFQRLKPGQTRWIQFLLTLPKKSHGKKSPVAIYAHGLGFFKEAAMIQAYNNANNGFATIAIDHPHHGRRVLEGEPYLLRLISHEHLPEMISLSFQVTTDHLSLYYALKSSLTKLDVVPKEVFRTEGDLPAADGLADLDPNFIVFQGLSLGGVMGSAFAAIVPFDGVFLQVSGVNISRILAKSVLWRSLFKNLVPPNTAHAEVAFAMSAYQQRQDYGDGLNFLDFKDAELKASGPKKFTVVYGLGDQIVGEFAPLGVARLLNLPLVHPTLDPSVGLRESEILRQGSGIVQMRGLLDGTPAAGLTAHFSMFLERGRNALAAWFTEIKKLKS